MRARWTGSSFSTPIRSTRRPPIWSLPTRSARPRLSRISARISTRPASLSHWHIPAAHYLESWSDARAYDGTVSIVQPMIDPLYGGKTAHDVFQTLLDEPQLSAYEAVRDDLEASHQGRFRNRLAQGAACRLDRRTPPSTRRGKRAAAFNAERFPRPLRRTQLEIIFRPDPNIYDGRWSNVGWLQELPKPVTNLSWDNAAIVSGATLDQAWTSKKTTSSRSASAAAR